jgi:hypothetical protein
MWDVDPFAFPQSLPDFDNVGAAYKFKTSNELRRALLIFRLCGIPPLVQNSRRLIDASYKACVVQPATSHCMLRVSGIVASPRFSLKSP